MLFASIATSVVLLLVIIYPLFFTKNELLTEATGEASLEGVRKLKKALLDKYLEEEQLFEEKELNALVWKQRQQYYINRYIDASRREDYLVALSEEGES